MYELLIYLTLSLYYLKSAQLLFTAWPIIGIIFDLDIKKLLKIIKPTTSINKLHSILVYQLWWKELTEVSLSVLFC